MSLLIGAGTVAAVAAAKVIGPPVAKAGAEVIRNLSKQITDTLRVTNFSNSQSAMAQKRVDDNPRLAPGVIPTTTTPTPGQ